MDITELILRDHHDQRHLFALLDDVDRSDSASLATIWEQLAILLEVHAAAEEEHFYPALLGVGSGATDAEDPEEETQDAITDHNDIRGGVAAAGRHDVGGAEWWDAVARTRAANSDHMGEEERQALADFRRHADLETRHDLGVAFARYEAEHAGGITATNEDADDYIADRT